MYLTYFWITASKISHIFTVSLSKGKKSYPCVFLSDMGSRGKTLHILNLGTRWGRMASLSLGTLYLQCESYKYTLERKIGELQS